MSYSQLGHGSAVAQKISSGKSLIVGVGDMRVSDDPTAEIATFSLGSCIGVTIYDPVRKIGGLLHLMLPDSGINATRALSQPCMFANTGVPALFKAVCALGADKHRLVVKIAGGAQFLDEQKIFNIGLRNLEALGRIFSTNGIAVAYSDVGGVVSRTMRLQLGMGKVSMHPLGKEAYLI